MQVHHSLQHLPSFKNAVVTIGSFDGVHLGHQKILETLNAIAARESGESILITFFPHPRKILTGKHEPVALLNTWEEKLEQLAKREIDHVVVVPFDTNFAEQSPEIYIQDFLVGIFKPHSIIIGYDHKFGKNRAGDISLLKNAEEKYGYKVEEIPEKLLENAAISSTIIRKALLAGDVTTAGDYLGYSYSILGKVVEGKKLGRTIGYPTANLGEIDVEKLIPGQGVYAVQVKVEDDEKLYSGMLNIGINPTVNGTGQHIEVHIFNFKKEIYGRMITLTFKKRIRQEIKFESLELLKSQLEQDEKNCREIFNNEM